VPTLWSSAWQRLFLLVAHKWCPSAGMCTLKRAVCKRQFIVPIIGGPREVLPRPLRLHPQADAAARSFTEGVAGRRAWQMRPLRGRRRFGAHGPVPSSSDKEPKPQAAR
jgi:hypothetical protein